MKKIVASVGLVALGASGIQSAFAQSLASPDATKPWSVSATLRGFYDDNTATIPNNVPSSALGDSKRDGFGLEVSPSAAFIWQMQQTTVNLGVLYSLKYYDNKPPGSTSHTDQVVTFNGTLAHNFNENWSGRVSDSFVLGQEPDLLRAGNTFATFERISGDNIRNYGTIALDGQITPEVGVGLGYDNAYYDYSAPEFAAILNRIEHRAHVEGLYLIQPETKGILGYQFTEFNYTGDQVIGAAIGPGNTLMPFTSSERNSREHTVYVGAEHSFSPQLTGSVRVGASYTEYYNDPAADAQWSPYVSASLKYNYTADSYVQGGISYDRSATDLVGGAAFAGGTLDSESAVAFASINHQLAPNLVGSLMVQFQNSSYNGGTFDNKDEQFYLAGLNLEYKFNPYVSANAGYNYDNLQSQLGRHFDRNRVYIGVTASY